MSLLIVELFSGFSDLLKYGDPRIENYFLMKSPVSIVMIVILYISFVFKFGPIIMEKRPPLKLDGIIMLYNWTQVILNGIVFYLASLELPKLNVLCTPMDKSTSPDAITIMNLQYYYFLLKILDLIDTIFFVLRKKNKQITFLHVYHHLTMAIYGWTWTKFFVGGHIFFLGYPNLFVHVVMYFYYFLSNWNHKYSIWWKKYITQLQICQHVFIFFSFLLPLLNPNCSYPKPLAGIAVIQAGLMIYLFVKFYIGSYHKKEKVHSE